MTNFASICVNWTVYDVPAIWAMVGPEREWVSREQTSAWLRTSEMLDSHSRNLQALREQVAEQWSPAGSEASQALLVQLDSLIGSTASASVVARTNATALGLLVDALMEAKAGIEPLHEAWSSAVTNVQRDKLNQQARAVMSQADSRVIEHASLLTVPPDYVPPRRDDPGTDVPPSGSSGPSIRPAEIPPLREPSPLPAREVSGPGNGGIRSGADAAAPGSPGGSADPPPWDASPPVLAGGSPPSAPASDLDDPLPAPAPSQFRESPGGRVLPVGGVLGLPAPTPGTIGPRSAAGAAFGGEPERTGAPGPIDGVIGGKPDAIANRTGQAAPAGPGEPMEGGLLGGGMGAGGLRPLGIRRRQYPADEEWETPAGVEPVITPPPPPDPRTAFDPGPNVIGLGR